MAVATFACASVLLLVLLLWDASHNSHTFALALCPHCVARTTGSCAYVSKRAFHPCDRLVIIADNPFAMLHNLPVARADEFERVLSLNLASPFVSEVHLLNGAPKRAMMSVLRADDKNARGFKNLHVYDLGWRSTFLDAVRYANAALAPGTVFAVANADISFSDPSVLIATRLVDPDAVLALSRFDVEADRNIATLHEDPPWSQDAWIMRTPFPEHLDLDFPLGSLGSDNKLAHLFTTVLNKTVYNWCEDIALLHLHSSQVRSAKPRLPMPYAQVPVTRLNLSAVAWRWCFREVRLQFDLLPPNASLAGRLLKKTATINVASIDLGSALLSGISVRNTTAGTRRRLHLRSENEGLIGTSHAQLMSKRPTVSHSIYRPTKSSQMQNAAAVKDMYLELYRQQQTKRRWTYLDLPWDILARTRSPLQDGRILDDMTCHHGRPVGDLGRVFALLPRDAVPAVCRGSRQWSSQLRLGLLSPEGQFERLVICPPLLHHGDADQHKNEAAAVS